MARTASPLRYPGGKSALLKMVSTILRLNRVDRGHYVEPFAGGGGLALALLFKGDVAEIHLNDVDPAIAALWNAMLHSADDLIDLMMTTPISVEERERQRTIYLKGGGDTLLLGFSALYLNRVNRSGIIKTGGVIGGLAQNGNYRMDCRFNREDLAARIRRISKYSNRIHFSSLDARVFLKSIDGCLPRRALIYADPPYFSKGAELYTSAFELDDHESLRDRLFSLETGWILTYDNVPEIRDLYKARRQFTFDINYSAQKKRVGNELLVPSKGLRLPEELRRNQVHRPQYHKRSSMIGFPEVF